MNQPPPGAPIGREHPRLASVILHPAFFPMLSRAALEGIVEAAITELDRRDGDVDLEPEEDIGELDHLPDDDTDSEPEVCHEA